MPSVLAIVSGAPPALEGRSLIGGRLSVEVRADPSLALRDAPSAVYDLLVLAGMPVDEQQATATAFQQHRRWRLVPVLYVLPLDAPGFMVPGSYRPELDRVARGPFHSPEIARRMTDMAHDGVSTTELIVAGAFELDPIHGRLRLREREVALTAREAEIMAFLLAQPNRTVGAAEIIERAWAASPDERHLQILRRHISNIRRKLTELGVRSVRTVRGAGYRFDAPAAG